MHTATKRPLLLTMQNVMTVTNLSRRTIYKLISSKQFPQPVYPKTNSPRFHEKDIIEWINNLTTTKPRKGSKKP